MNLDGTQNAFFNPYSSVGAQQLETGFGRPVRRAMAVDHPAGHECAMANYCFGDLAFDGNASSTDQQTIEHETAASFTFHVKGVRPVGLPVEQAQHRPFTVGRPQLKTLVLMQVNTDLFDVNAAVGNFDYRMRM